MLKAQLDEAALHRVVAKLALGDDPIDCCLIEICRTVAGWKYSVWLQSARRRAFIRSLVARLPFVRLARQTSSKLHTLGAPWR